MKKIIASLLLLILVFSLVSCGEEDPTPEGMQNVAIESARFNLYVPESWASTSSSGISGARVGTAGDNSNVTATVYYPDDQNLTAAAYFETVAKPSYATELKDYALLEDLCGETTLGGRDAVRIVFTYVVDGNAYEVMQIAAAKDTMIYMLTYTAPSTLYASHTEDVESIRDAFTFR